MSFCRDLCSGVVGNIRYCMTTPITKKKLLITGGVMLVIILLIIIIAVTASGSSSSSSGGSRDPLAGVPLVNGNLFVSKFLTANFEIAKVDYSYFTGIAEGAQILTTSVRCTTQYKDAVAQTVDQLDFMERMVNGSIKNGKILLRLATTADELHKNSLVSGSNAVLFAIGGGHAIDQRLSLLRTYYKMGVRVMTLASEDCSNPWAASAGKKDTINTDFLKAVVAEMNRLGMVIDLAGSSQDVQTAVLDASKAPVVYRGVGLASKVKKDININDDTLAKLKEKKGLLMLSLDCSLITEGTTCTDKEYIDLLKDAKTKLGVDLLGMGGALSPKANTPFDLKDVSKVFDQLKREGWGLTAIQGLKGDNFLQLLRQVEKMASRTEPAGEAFFDVSKLPDADKHCYSEAVSPAPTQPPAPTQATTQATIPTPSPTPSTENTTVKH